MSEHIAIFVRHAQAEDSAAGGDEQRALTEAGKTAARELGRKLSSDLTKVGKVLVSPAKRAQETWAAIAEGSGLDLPEAEVSPVVYSGDAEGIIEQIRVGDRNEAVVVVGHIPTIVEAAKLVAKEDVEIPASLAPGTAILVEASRDWKEWHSHVGTTASVVA